MTKKQLLPTFANLITDAEVKNNYGFVYMVKVCINGINKLYIGQKCFHDLKNPWQTYTTSSKIVKSMIKANVPVEYAVIALCKNKQALNAEESKHIVSTWKKLSDLGRLYMSLNFAVGKVKRDRILKGIGVDVKRANCSVQKSYVAIVKGEN